MVKAVKKIRKRIHGARMYSSMGSVLDVYPSRSYVNKYAVNNDDMARLAGDVSRIAEDFKTAEKCAELT